MTATIPATALRFLFTLVLLSGVLRVTTVSAAETNMLVNSSNNLTLDKGLGLVMGIYRGQVKGGEQGETVFFANAAGELEGLFFTHSGDLTSVGYLRNLKLCCGGVLIGRWEDSTGSGQVIINFQDPEYSYFVGTWGDLHAADNGGEWNGRKI